MVRLQLIGFTTDLKNLIFATRRTAQRGGYIVEIDKRLQGALEEVAKLEAEAGAPPGPSQKPDRPARATQPAVRPSALSPKEIQTLLREGKSEEQVAKLAKTDVSWIRRFTAPIIAERAGVIDSVRAGVVAKPRLGPSAVSVGQAIEQNLIEKRVQMDPDTFEKSWKATRRAGRWQVVFQYASRGKRRFARFSFDPESRKVTAANEVALDVGWRPNNSRRIRRASSGLNSGRRTASGARGSAKPAGSSGKKKSVAKGSARTTRKQAPGNSRSGGRGAGRSRAARAG